MANPVQVKWYLSTMTGAPTLSGTAGALIGVLDACLKDGFNTVTLSSLVVASSVATATVNTGHGFTDHVVVLVAGATPSGLNGDKRITVTGANTFTFDATGISDQTATGTITAKMSPGGFSKAFSGTNLAAYRSDDITGNRLYWRIDDTNTTYARQRGYETMSDVSTGTGLFPTEAQISGGSWIWKSSSANSNARPWAVYTDGRIVYFCNAHDSSSGNWDAGGQWGQYDSYASDDPYGSILIGPNSASGASYFINLNVNASSYLCRSYTKLGTAVSSTRYSSGATPFYMASPAGGSVTAYPDVATNSLRLWPVEVWEGAGSYARGILPGVWNPIHSMSYLPGNWTLFNNCAQLPGRKLILQKYNSCACVIDLTGPWR